MRPLRKSDRAVVGGAVVVVVELLVVRRRRRRLPGVVLAVEGWGLGRAVGARDVGLGLGFGVGLGHNVLFDTSS